MKNYPEKWFCGVPWVLFTGRRNGGSGDDDNNSAGRSDFGFSEYLLSDYEENPSVKNADWKCHFLDCAFSGSGSVQSVPGVADFCSGVLGIYATTNFLFLFAIFVLIVKVFYMSVHISQLESQVKELVQRIALDEKMRQEKEAEKTGGAHEK